MISETCDIEALYRQAQTYEQHGLLSEASSIYTVLLQHPCHHAAIWNSYGNLCVRRKLLPEAKEAFLTSLSLHPLQSEIFLRLSIIFKYLGSLDQAVIYSDKILALEPNSPDAYREKGVAFFIAHHFQEALTFFKQSLVLDPNHPRTLSYLTLCQQAAEKKEENLAEKEIPIFFEVCRDFGDMCFLNQSFELAIWSYQQALLHDRSSIAVWCNLGCSYLRFRQSENALNCFDQAESLDANNAYILSVKGSALLDCGMLDKALEYYNRSLQLDVSYTDTHIGKSNVFHKLKRWQEAIEILENILAKDPTCIDALWNLSLIQLTLGIFESGWKNYESRIIQSELKFNFKHLPKPKLTHLEVRDKTIYIYHEQGFGDTIQFARYLPLLCDLGARVVFEPQFELQELLLGLDKRIHIVTQGSIIPDYDLQTPLLSLPYVFHTCSETIPSRLKYLTTPLYLQKKWKTILGEKKQFRLGIVSSGKQFHVNDRNRSIPLCFFEPFFNLPIELHLIHKEIREEDLLWCRKHPKLFLHYPQIFHFSDTAALIEEMDLIISVDTSVAHLSAALGKPTWILLPYVSDFRWGCDGCASPWYPTVRLFRQDEEKDYKKVLTEVMEHLKEMIEQNDPKVLKILEKIYMKELEGFVDEAELEYRHLLSEYPNHTLLMSCLGALLLKKNDFDRAIQYLELSFQKSPNDLAALFNCGVAYLKKEERTKALAFVEKALSLDPAFPDALTIKSIILHEDKFYDEAIECSKKALEKNPNLMAAYCNLSHSLAFAGRYKEAEEVALRGLQIQPSVTLFYNASIACIELGEYPKAKEYIQLALALDKDFAEGYFCLANCHFFLDQYPEAIEYHHKFQKLKPDFAASYWNEALIYLMTAEFAKGWKLYEWRFLHKELGIDLREYSQPRMMDLNIQDKIVYLYPEQGYGDVIQFCRYALELSKIVLKVILEVPKELHRLMITLDPSIEIVSTGTSKQDFDIQSPLLSLPRIFNTQINTIPSYERYLSAPSQLVKDCYHKIAHISKIKCGLVIQGYLHHFNDKRRSMAIEDILPLFDEPIEFFLLQKEITIKDAAAFKSQGVHILQNEIFDFADTAAWIENMDLVISVDTSVAHLAGALGKKVIIALPYRSDFRWLRQRTDSPWYPSAILIRQKAPWNWSDVIEETKKILRSMVENKYYPKNEPI